MSVIIKFTMKWDISLKVKYIRYKKDIRYRGLELIIQLPLSHKMVQMIKIVKNNQKLKIRLIWNIKIL